jgi:chemotaxis protein CheD
LRDGIAVASNVQVVPIGEMAASGSPADVLVAYGLGSCVAVCLYDPVAKVGGMLHALLPTVPNGKPASNPKFVDRGVPLLLESLLELGARRSRLIARLCGGAQMLGSESNRTLNIGQLNVLAVEVALKAARLKIHAQTTGGHSGRTVRFYLADGTVTVRTLEQGERVLS